MTHDERPPNALSEDLTDMTYDEALEEVITCAFVEWLGDPSHDYRE